MIEDAVLLKLVGFKPVIVHGGGKEISSWMRKTGIEPRFIDGLRVTDADTLELAEMVLGKFIDDAVIAGLSQVLIIHGKGTGALRKGVHAYLKSHRNVLSFQFADINEGGTGATVVELK